MQHVVKTSGGSWGVLVSWSHLLPGQLFSLLRGWTRVGEIGCALPSKIVLKERVGWFTALPHLSSSMGNPLVDAHAKVCFLVAVRMSSCSNSSCCWCCCSWSLLKLLLFLEQSLTPLSLFFLSHSTTTATIQGAGSACIQSCHLFSVAAGL